MEKNGKIFVAPPKDGSDFKEVFKQLAAVGAGRPVGTDGFPQGPWTPELLAEAITEIDSNRAGIDLRTVQLWFQENDKGISPSNIAWLARIFGCDDKEATSEWLLELSAAQSRLIAKRRDSRKTTGSTGLPDMAGAVTLDSEAPISDEVREWRQVSQYKKRLNLARRSEALFASGSPLNLPALTFAGASALGFLSYIVGIHSVTYNRPDGISKQVGFLWAPNWTLLFMILLPLFFWLVTELLLFWKRDARFSLLAQADRFETDAPWSRNIESYSDTYWAVFVICVLIAGVLQWIGVCLIPLLKGGGDYATSWGTIAIVQPDLISVPMEIAFTGLAYLYMCLCFYLFFAGLILLHTIIHDFGRIEEGLIRLGGKHRSEGGEIRMRIMRGIFRCTIVGVLIAICMKVQSSYLSSNGGDIVTWILHDFVSVVYPDHQAANSFAYRMPTHFSSLLVAISACVVFLYGSIRLNVGSQFREALWKMSAVESLLFAAYLLIDAFDGFSILLSAGVLVAAYGLFDPEFALPRSRKSETNHGVS
ncbi:RcgA family putative transporter [Rhizobium etli]|uniref:RcgA family putative transporter n=1 Tax=Rhizobium etli TaxID=29449 RepID=UPI0003839BDD|nr:hypothetical protein [Rhizobium etli]AGS25145.1 hypothetical protein REMIM1_PE00053 [Rhizobium etli bv. mimosae str. Mim1]